MIHKNEKEIDATIHRIDKVVKNVSSDLKDDAQTVEFLIEILYLAKRTLLQDFSDDSLSKLDISFNVIKVILGNSSLSAETKSLLSDLLEEFQNNVEKGVIRKRLFISYAWADDKGFVEKLYWELIGRGYSVWWDRESLPSRGFTIAKELRDAIFSEIDCMLAVVGPNALTSVAVQSEWAWASEFCKTIVPILRHSTSAELPEDFKQVLFFDFNLDEEFYSKADELDKKALNINVKTAHLLNVPPLPPNYLPRPVNDIVHHLISFSSSYYQSTEFKNRERPLVLYGMGGSGKTTLAVATVNNCAVRKFFYDGIVWISVGQSPDIRSLFERVGLSIGDGASNYPDFTIADQRLREIIGPKVSLIVLDDVWDYEVVSAFNNVIANSRNQLLITTRNRKIATILDAMEHHVEVFSEKESVLLLEQWTHKQDPKYSLVAEKLGYLPLAIKLAGARMANSMSANEWLSRYTEKIEIVRISSIHLDRHTNNRDLSLAANISLGVEKVFPSDGERLLYYTLGIFQEDTRVPQQVVLKLWQKIRPDLSKEYLLDVIDELVDLALVEKDVEFQTITLHDILSSYNKEMLGDEWSRVHSELLSAYNPKHTSWFDIENDGYIYQYLIYHLSNSMMQSEIIALLESAPSWFREKARKQQIRRNFPQEHLIVKLYSDFLTKSPQEAHKFLAKWLRDSNKISAKGRIYQPESIAVLCALSSKDDRIILQALKNNNEGIRQAAIASVFLRYRSEPTVAINTLVAQLCDDAVNAWGLPRPRIIITIVSIIYLLVIYENMEGYVLSENTLTLFRMAKQVMRKAIFPKNTLVRPFTRLIHNLAIILGVQFLMNFTREINRRYETDGVHYTVQNMVEMQSFIDDLSNQNSLIRKVLPYLNKSSGSLMNIKEDLIQIYGDRGFKESSNLLFHSVIGLLLTIHGITNHDEVYPIIKSIYDLEGPEEWRDANKITMIYVLRMIYISLRPGEIKKEWVDELESLTRVYYESAKEYGFFWSPKGIKYEYYPLPRYIEIASILYPGQPIEMLRSYLNINQDEKLLLHILRGFNFPNFQLRNYSGIAHEFFPLLFHNNGTIVSLVIDVLAKIRIQQEKLIDDLLKIHNVPGFLVEKIVERSHFESFYSYAHRDGEFFAPILGYVDPYEILWLTDGLQDALLDSKDVSEVFKKMMHSFLDFIEN